MRQDSPAARGRSAGPDFALIRLDRKVTGHNPLAINRSAGLAAGDGLFVIGHPVGLPLKVAGGATVRDVPMEGYFTTDLDTFSGSSGSPVFNAKTKLIEGILARGDEDFVLTPAGCAATAAYAQNGGRGEEATKISILADFIPAQDGPAAEAAVKTLNIDLGVPQPEPGPVHAKGIRFD